MLQYMLMLKHIAQRTFTHTHPYIHIHSVIVRYRNEPHSPNKKSYGSVRVEKKRRRADIMSVCRRLCVRWRRSKSKVHNDTIEWQKRKMNRNGLCVNGKQRTQTWKAPTNTTEHYSHVRTLMSSPSYLSHIHIDAHMLTHTNTDTHSRLSTCDDERKTLL